MLIVKACISRNFRLVRARQNYLELKMLSATRNISPKLSRSNGRLAPRVEPGSKGTRQAKVRLHERCYKRTSGGGLATSAVAICRARSPARRRLPPAVRNTRRDRARRDG